MRLRQAHSEGGGLGRGKGCSVRRHDPNLTDRTPLHQSMHSKRGIRVSRAQVRAHRLCVHLLHGLTGHPQTGPGRLVLPPRTVAPARSGSCRHNAARRRAIAGGSGLGLCVGEFVDGERRTGTPERGTCEPARAHAGEGGRRGWTDLTTGTIATQSHRPPGQHTQTEEGEACVTRAGARSPAVPHINRSAEA